ncbi:MAG: ATP-dependent Clp protease adaptor ClpS [Desulfovibrionales bacterium]|nr:ATP-dependent Clp protease adaptor ClpS [Desulfovibrionales bacterium]
MAEHNRPDLDSDILLEECVKEPRKFRVLMHNDDYTTMDFVILVLVEVFRKTTQQATQVMLSIHEKGVGECGIYTAEVAETKIAIVRGRAKEAGYPLKCTMEEV